MRVCPVCEGYTSSEVVRCSTCDAPMIGVDEIVWARRERVDAASNPWLDLVVAGKYRVQGVLGKGGMGTVYRAIHEVSLSPVALKVLHPRFAQVPEFKRTLIDEARKASLLRSEHVARVFDVGETPEGSVFIAMELVEGATLHDIIQRQGKLGAHVVVQLVRQLCDALADAQSAGITHRDLSPKNIMIETRGTSFRAKVLDFGIARLTGLANTALGGQDAGLWVNPPFTAPEILVGQPGDHRSDLYSVGVIAYYASSGRLPHGGLRLEERVREVVESEPAPLTPSLGTPRRLVRLVGRLLAKDPDARPQTASEVRDAVDAVERPHGVAFRVASVLALIAGSTAFLTGLLQSRDPKLQSTSVSSLVLSDSPQSVGRPQFIRREQLERARFQVSDLRDSELSVRVYDAGELVLERALGGVIRRGELELDAARDAGWREVVARCAALRRPVSLDFHHDPSNRLLAYSAVFVDVDTPRLEDANIGSTLNASSRFEARIVEDGLIARVAFRLVRRGVNISSFDYRPRDTERLSIAIGRMFIENAKPGATLDGLGGLQMVCLLEDRTGRSTSRSFALTAVDLSIPDIRSVTGLDGKTRLEVDEGKCRVRVALSKVERRLAAFHVEQLRTDGSAVPRVYERSQLDVQGDSFTVPLDVPGEPGDAEFRFWIRDSAGNESRPVRRLLTFRSLDLESTFRAGDLPPHAAKFDVRSRQLVLAHKAQARVEYRCSRSFVPSVRGPNPAVRVVERKPGRLGLEVGPVAAPGKFSVVIEHRRTEDSTSRPLARTERIDVLVLPAPATVQPDLEATAGTKWRPEVTGPNRSLGSELDARGAWVVFPGPALGVTLSAELGARARLLVERAGRWTEATALIDVTSPNDLAALRVPLVEGRNRIALDIVDRLGRPVEDAGPPGRNERHIDTGSAQAVLIADFRHDATAPELPADVAVEFGRPAVVHVYETSKFGGGAEFRLMLANGRSWPGTGRRLADGRTDCSFSLPFDAVRELGGWETTSAGDFVAGGARRVQLGFVSPAGRFPVVLGFRPTRSLLRAKLVRELAPEAVPPVIGEIRLVPFLSPPARYAVDLGPLPGVDTSGSLVLKNRVRVTGVGEFFLAGSEISRRAYAAFVSDVLVLAKAKRLDVKLLGHAEDPKGAQRFTRAGLAPSLDLFGVDLERLVRLAGDRPITGVAYFQAQAFARWLGWRWFGDADFFRLPFGAELEWAALGRNGPDAARLNGLQLAPGSSARDWRDRYAAARRVARQRGHVDPTKWPPSPRELLDLGDWALAWDNDRVSGLDLGVREWVEDLPLIGVPDAYPSRVELHPRHIALARRRRAGEDLGLPVVHALVLGELRGLGWAEPVIEGRDPLAGLIDARGGDRAIGFLGVKRMSYLRRDAQGLVPGTRSPRVAVVGFRVVGSEAFVRMARDKLR